MGPYYGGYDTGLLSASARDLLVEGKAHQLAGRLREAAECFALSVDAGGNAGGDASIAESLRRLGIVHHMQGESEAAMEYCRRSREMALQLHDARLGADATVAMANMAFEQGNLPEARELYHAAVALAPGAPDLAARIAQNLGNLESVEGNAIAALEHFGTALEEYRALSDLRGAAMACHNIGRIEADEGRWSDADAHYQDAGELARQCGDRHLEALCLVNHAEIALTLGRPDKARRQAELAFRIFEELGARIDMADASRMLGNAFRAVSRATMAESRYRSAIEIAVAARAPLVEAESRRDLATLYLETYRRQAGRDQLDRAVMLFGQVGARRQLAKSTCLQTELGGPLAVSAAA